MEALIQIQFDSTEQQKDFSKWFSKVGFDMFIDSKINKQSCEPITCLATDDETEFGHYFELQ